MELGSGLREGGAARARPVRTIALPLGLGLLGLVVAAAALAVQLTAEVPWPAIAGDQLVGVSYMVAGTIAWLHRPGNRIGPAILLAGITWYIPVFVRIPIPAVTSATFALAWVANTFVAFVLLTYPTGHFFSRAARVVFGVALLSTALPIIARLFLLDSGTDFSSATGPSGLTYGCDCPNPFALFPDDRLYGGVMLVGRLLAVVVAALVLVMIVRRWWQASSAGRRQLAPVLFAGAVGVAAFVVDEIAFTASSGEQPILAATTVVLVFARAAVPIGFLLGLLRTQIDRTLVGRLVVELGGAPSPERIEAMVASTLHDPTARVGYWSPAAQAYLDAAGHRIEPAASAERAIAVVERDRDQLCVIEYDGALRGEPELIAAVVAALRLAVDRDRLETMVRAQVAESRSLPRGSVTLLYSDIQGSTALLERLASAYGDLLAATRRIQRAVVREHGGREVDSRADEFFAVFPAGTSPASAALEVDRRLRDHAWPDDVAVRVRIGLHHGEPDLGDEGYVGMDVHMVARLGAVGHGGQILVSASAADMIAADLPADARLLVLGTFELRGIPGRHQIMQLVVPDLPAEFSPLRTGSTRIAANPT
ncbi:MAG: adenylate/guanylate cyclase domain-containing protein [Candidatus Limnocylindrales bacterium]